MRDKAYLKSVWLQLKANGVENMPHYEDVNFPRFAWRHGFSPISPAREARIEAILARYAERAALADLPDARIYVFPSEPLAVVFDLAAERLERRGNSA